MISLESEQRLLSLAPLALPNFRTRRYHGDDQCLPLAAFVPEDRQRLVDLYEFLKALLEALSPALTAPPTRARMDQYLGEHSLDAIISVANQFGRASHEAQPTAMMAKTVHDLRGGGLTSLLGQLQLWELGWNADDSLNALYFLTRDHLKIMRNALLGLDDQRRQEDLEIKIHGTDFIVEKWDGAKLHHGGREITLQVECPQPTAISECCVEFGALDRILYNLINNACRHAAAETIRLILLPVPDREGENLRFILINTVSPKDLAHLRQIDLDSLFREGTSTTGSGYGLAIANDFVSHAYGLKSESQAVLDGYLGASLLDDDFAAWFHWPRILED